MMSVLKRILPQQQETIFSIRRTLLGSRVIRRRQLSSSGAVDIFDRNSKRIQRNRACSVDNPGLYDYLRDAVAEQVVDRVCDVARLG